MKKASIRQKYDLTWETKEDNDFNFYERNHRLDEFFIRKGRVLDVACGSGTVGVWLQKRGFEVVGLDISEAALNLAKRKGLSNVILQDVERRLPFKKETFDYVFCGDILEHLFSPARLIEEVWRVLVPGGSLIISVPNMGYWYYRLAYLIKGEVPKTEGLSAEPWNWEHTRFFNQKILNNLLRETRFLPTKLVGVCRKPTSNFLARFYPNLFASIIIMAAKKS